MVTEEPVIPQNATADTSGGEVGVVENVKLVEVEEVPAEFAEITS
jgi:hypothetical protein